MVSWPTAVDTTQEEAASNFTESDKIDNNFGQCLLSGEMMTENISITS